MQKSRFNVKPLEERIVPSSCYYDPCSCDPEPVKQKGNNGVGNGLDPQPPGNPPINDGVGTGPGNPGNRGGK